MRVLTVLLCIVACTFAACGDGNDGASDSRGGSIDRSGAAMLITADSHLRFRVGRYTLAYEAGARAATSLADVETRLGRADRCSGKFATAEVRWTNLGIAGSFTTLGGFADRAGKPLVMDGSWSACDFRDQLQVDTMTATAPRWHTRQGLTIGDPLDRLLELYPRAVQDGLVWWLRAHRSAIAGGDELPYMTARVVGGTVRSITVIIRAQGE